MGENGAVCLSITTELGVTRLSHARGLIALYDSLRCQFSCGLSNAHVKAGVACVRRGAVTAGLERVHTGRGLSLCSPRGQRRAQNSAWTARTSLPGRGAGILMQTATEGFILALSLLSTAVFSGIIPRLGLSPKLEGALRHLTRLRLSQPGRGWTPSEGTLSWSTFLPFTGTYNSVATNLCCFRA